MVSFDELKQYRYIVIGLDHYNPLGVVRGFGMKGIKPVLIVKKRTADAPRMASASKYVDKLHEVDSFDELPELLLSHYADKEKRPFVYPCDDVATGVLDRNYDRLKDYFCIENCGEQGRLEHFKQKTVLLEAATRNGLNVPRLWDLQDGIPDDIIYPVITKPYKSYEGWKRDYFICNNEEELKSALEKVSGRVFVQQYIKKVNELVINGMTYNGGKDNFTSIATLYTYLLPDSFSLEMKVFAFDDADLKNKIDHLFADIGYNGVYDLECLVDDKNEKWFLETNFRNSTWSWASTCLGMNLPLLWAYAMVNGRIPENALKSVPEGYIALAEVADFDQRVKKRHMISVGQWFKGVLRADCLYYFDKKDMMPIVHIWTKKISNLFLRRKRVKK